jgi:hypothetical protein
VAEPDFVGRQRAKDLYRSTSRVFRWLISTCGIAVSDQKAQLGCTGTDDVILKSRASNDCFMA